MDKIATQKIAKKTSSPKLFFWCNVAFPEGKTLNFSPFWLDFESPRTSFSDVFSGFRFGMKFEAFFAKNLIKAKTRKVAFAS